jgi:hypothetical protein
MVMETNKNDGKGNQCWQNGPKPPSDNWQQALLEASQVTRWNV